MSLGLDDLQAESFWVLQHFDPTYDLELRYAKHAARLERIDEDMRYVFEPGTVGDIICSTFWPPVGGRRPHGAWAFAFPTTTSGVVSNPPPAASEGTSTKAAQATRAVASVPAAPLFSARLTDNRFSQRRLRMAGDGDHQLPLAWPGITISATNERAQEELFFPAYGPLVAAHRGNPKVSALVSEAEGDRLDTTRQVGLHSAFRVLRGVAAGGVDGSRAVGKGIALQYGATAEGGVPGWGMIVGRTGRPTGDPGPAWNGPRFSEIDRSNAGYNTAADLFFGSTVSGG